MVANGLPRAYVVYQVGITARSGKLHEEADEEQLTGMEPSGTISLQGVQLLVLGSGYRIRKRFDHDPASQIGDCVQSC